MTDVPANLTLRQAAVLLFGDDPTVDLDKSMRTLTRLATGSTPRIGSLKIRGVRVYPLEAIEAYIKANTTTPPPPNTWGLVTPSRRNTGKRS